MADAVRIERLAASPLNILPGNQTINEDQQKIFSAAMGTRISIEDGGRKGVRNLLLR